jgi:hypothetical protein
VTHGFLYSGGTYTTVDDPLGTNGSALIGINNAGQIFGAYFDANNAGHNFIAEFASSSGQSFAFDNSNFGQNLVTNFNPAKDLIQFNHALFANYAAVMGAESFDGHNTTITYDANDTVTLQNVAPTALSASNFKFT